MKCVEKTVREFHPGRRFFGVTWRMKASSAVLEGCVILAALLSGGSAAQSASGTMASQSRATIRISVSVMPHPEVTGSSQNSGVAESQSSGGPPAISLNIPGLRYTLLEYPFESSKPTNGADRQGLPLEPRLVLIVPD